MLLTKIEDLKIGSRDRSRNSRKKVEIICDDCGAQLNVMYKTYLHTTEVYNKTLCWSCQMKYIYQRTDYTMNKRNNSNENKRSYIEKYGKEKAERTKEKISKTNKGINRGGTWADAWKKEENRIEFCRSIEERFGKEKSDKIKEKQSICSKGVNNHNYGKPSPQGSGNGWSGWYKNIFFRSIIELSYLYYMFENNIKFENAEQKKYAIEYINYKGDVHTYFPDYYLIKTEELIEVKPRNLLKTIENSAKFTAAKELYGDKFKVLTEEDIKILKFKELYSLYLAGNLRWMDKYKIKFEQMIGEEGIIND